MGRVSNCPPELRARAIRMVAEVTPDYPSQWAAITAVAQELGIGTAETLRKWVRRAEVVPRALPGSDKPGARRDQAAQTRGLRAAASQRDPQGSLHFVRGGARPPTSPLVSFINDHKAEFGLQPICAVLCEHGARSPRRPITRTPAGHHLSVRCAMRTSRWSPPVWTPPSARSATHWTTPWQSR